MEARWHFFNGLTNVIFFGSFILGAFAFAKAMALLGERRNFFNNSVAFGFGVYVAAGFWTGLTYLLWLADVPLHVGAIQNGEIYNAFWLPFLCFTMAYCSYLFIKPK